MIYRLNCSLAASKNDLISSVACEPGAHRVHAVITTIKQSTVDELIVPLRMRRVKAMLDRLWKHVVVIIMI